jgi:hypothetical protein
VSGIGFTIGGRGNGKSLLYRRSIEDAAIAGQHVHAAARDGTWCITMTGVGLLWVKLWQSCPEDERRNAVYERYAYGKPGIRL